MVSFSKASSILFCTAVFSGHVASGQGISKGADLKKFAAGVKQLRTQQKKSEKGQEKRTATAGELGTSGLEGTYAMVFETGPNLVSALAVIDYDGAGNLSGDMRVNTLDEANDPARMLFAPEVTGTYSLDSSGLGTQHLSIGKSTSPLLGCGGVISDTDILVTKAEGTNVHTLAGNLHEASHYFPGELSTFTLTQRESMFDTNSVNGKYAFTLTGGSNAGEALGVFTFDAGTVTGELRGNGPNNSTMRSIFRTDVTGSYEVEHHGFMTMQLTFVGPGFEFPITALIVEADGEQALTLSGNYEVPSPRLAPLGVNALVVFNLDYLGPV